VAVVVVHEDAEHSLEVSAVDDEEPVETLGACGADEALGDRVRLRRLDRRQDDLEAFAAEDGVEVADELAVTIADQEPSWCRSLRQGPGKLPGLLGDPGAAGVRRAAGKVHAPAAELDEEEHVQPPQGNGLHGEEVDGEHAVGLRTEELAPRRSGALARRSEAAPPKQLAHRGGRHREAEATELAGDPLVAPARVLTGEA
jgi:hypothetical protein